MRLLVLALCGLIATPILAATQPLEERLSKAVLVTGASSGIGRKITERLAADGYFVYATARKDEDLKALAAIKNVQPLRLDVTHPAEITAAVESVTKAGRGLYGLVNNAGIATFGTIADMTPEEFDLSMKVNVYGPVMMVKAFESMIIAQKGRVINIGSVSGILATRDLAAYQMSKHAIEALTDSLALQLAPFGAQASVIEPGAYNSHIVENMLARLSPEGKTYVQKVEGPKKMDAHYPEPDEVAVAVEDALFEPTPKRRYLVIPRHFTDPINAGLAERTIRGEIEQLVQLNEGQPYTFDRATLIKMLDDALSTARPRTD
ncbi:MAG TPA: SDR family oxidoreductase [Steroidobacteraceae bacterium]|jgi:NAD(P)-dependent dehydrogenase (short-subunit alcohol dehydrogenase family)|nr:SDR family oxidoreductase [Steroidobacteraceae bacterium]